MCLINENEWFRLKLVLRLDLRTNTILKTSPIFDFWDRISKNQPIASQTRAPKIP